MESDVVSNLGLQVNMGTELLDFDLEMALFGQASNAPVRDIWEHKAAAADAGTVAGGQVGADLAVAIGSWLLILFQGLQRLCCQGDHRVQTAYVPP